MFLYFPVIPFILPFASRLVKGDGWAAVETEIFLLYSQAGTASATAAATRAAPPLNENNPQAPKKVLQCILRLSSGAFLLLQPSHLSVINGLHTFKEEG